MARLRALIINDRERMIRVSKISRRVQSTDAGNVITVGKHAYLLRAGMTWGKKRFFGFLSERRYVLLREGDPRPLTDKLSPAPYDSSMFKAAIESAMGLRFLRGGMDFQTMMMMILVLIVLVQVGVIAALAAFGAG